MTCIVGYTDKKSGVTYLGGDSLASTRYTGTTITQKKVFKLKDSSLILGFSGSIRDLNLLRYASNLIDKRDEPNINEEYIVTKFIPNVIKLFSNNGRNESDKGIESSESYFLLAYKEKLWKIYFDYSVCQVTDNYDSIGSGGYFALGSLKTTENMDDLSPIQKIHMALQSASKFSVGVAPPFFIINTNNDEIIELKE